MNPLPPTQDELLAAARVEREETSPRPQPPAALMTGTAAELLIEAEEHLRAAVTGLSLMRHQTSPVLLIALARDVDQLQQRGFGALSDALHVAGYVLPDE